MARPSNTGERRGQIARALRQVMAKTGYERATVSDVAAAAGLAPGLVHYHFKNKLEILLAVLERLVRRHGEELDRALALAAGDPVRELDRFLDFHLALGRSADPETLACWITLSGEALRQARVRKTYRAAIAAAVGRVAAIVRRGVAAGRFRCRRPEAAAAALVAAIQGYYVLAATAPDTIPRGSAAAAAKAMAAGLLRPAPCGTNPEEAP